jgi:iron-sulfur cluster assembly protein
MNSHLIRPFSRVARAPRSALSITETAAERIRALMARRSSDDELYGIKLGVRRRGCNGYSYVMDYCQSPEEVQKLDEVVEDKDVRVVVDAKALMFVVGMEMDYIDNEIKSEFVFNNPNSKGTCGCGESFHV